MPCKRRPPSPVFESCHWSNIDPACAECISSWFQSLWRRHGLPSYWCESPDGFVRSPVIIGIELVLKTREQVCALSYISLVLGRYVSLLRSVYSKISIFTIRTRLTTYWTYGLELQRKFVIYASQDYIADSNFCIALDWLCLGSHLWTDRVWEHFLSTYILIWAIAFISHICRSISGVFKNLHNFNSGQVGTACISIMWVALLSIVFAGLNSASI